MSRILVADDDPDIVALVKLRLERDGHVVVPAPDGQAALEALRAAPPDLAVLDVSMPGLDGLEVCRRARADPALAAVPILILTAAVQPADVDRARVAGATASMGKPFSPRALAERVRTLLVP